MFFINLPVIMKGLGMLHPGPVLPRRSREYFSRCLLPLLFLILVNTPGEAGILFHDDFNTPSEDVDRSLWTTPEGPAAFFGQTALRNPNIPDSMTDGLRKTVEVGASLSDSALGVARLLLSTYNPTDPKHLTFWGSEIDTIQTFSPTPEEGIAFEARVRASEEIPLGVITSIFGFGETGAGNLKDEIDIEFLSNLYLPSSTPQFLVNRFINAPPSATGRPEILSFPDDITATEFNTYKIVWFTDKIEWYVNDILVYQAGTAIPSHPLSMRLNIWVPGPEWAQAYHPDLLAAQDITGNVDYFYEIDYVTVFNIRTIPEPQTLYLLGGALLCGCFRRRTRGGVA
ncbi:MAG TPA: family 16 glycosylhydrolase [Candidatus Omnitrophota bacterium]|nr:family 16 glycosylhydrolase [Candidatus Omnitrophota bacterium]